MGRDAASDAAAASATAMAAYQAGNAYAIASIILYLTLTLSVVGMITFMGFIASTRVRRSPIFAIIVFAAALCIAAAAVNISQNRDLVVRPTDGIDRVRYTSLMTLSVLIPFVCDFTLILRIMAFYPYGSAPKWKRALVVAYPALIKIPRFVYIVMYIHFCWNATKDAVDMNVIVKRVNKVQHAVVEWSLMLSDQLYCTVILLYKLYGLGWGWGDGKHVGGSLLSMLRTIMYSALASFAIPSFFLVTLIVMQVSHYRPDIEGYIFAATTHLCIAGAAFACLLPAIRADHRSNRNGSADTFHHHASGCDSCHGCTHCSRKVEYEVSRDGGMLSQRKHSHLVSSTHAGARQSLRKSTSVTTSGDDLLDPPFLSYNRGRSGSVLSTRRLPPYAAGGMTASPKTVDEEEVGIEMTRHAIPASIEQGQSSSGSGKARSSTDRDEGQDDFIVGDDQPSAPSNQHGRHRDQSDVPVVVTNEAIRYTFVEDARAPAPGETVAIPRPSRSDSVVQDGQMTRTTGRTNSIREHGANSSGGDVGVATRSAPHACNPQQQCQHHTHNNSIDGGGEDVRATARPGFLGTVRNCSRFDRGRAVNPVDLSGILIVTTQEEWSSK